MDTQEFFPLDFQYCDEEEPFIHEQRSRWRRQEGTNQNNGPDVTGEKNMWLAVLKLAIEDYQYDPMCLSDIYQQREAEVKKSQAGAWLFKSERISEGSLNYICDECDIDKQAVREYANGVA